jgi:hypothetical protein
LGKRWQCAALPSTKSFINPFCSMILTFPMQFESTMRINIFHSSFDVSLQRGKSIERTIETCRLTLTCPKGDWLQLDSERSCVGPARWERLLPVAGHCQDDCLGFMKPLAPGSSQGAQGGHRCGLGLELSGCAREE